jgi:LL-diaminopimelate aminotransferase
MVKRNPNFLKLPGNYLFPEVARRVKLFKEGHPEADLVSLSIGDTSEPITAAAADGLSLQAAQLGQREGYRGYGPEQGDPKLRAKISALFYQGRICPDEIFISDGAKCDIGRLQLLFGSSASIAVQDPAYPVYAETGILLGNCSIFYLPCMAENSFFPDVASLPPVDLLYICSPNNPTGAVATKEQLTRLVEQAKKQKSLVIFDAAYSGFIQDPALPRTIYAIEGAEEVAIEVSSFSKLIGFTGVRLGWSVIPKKVCFEGGFSVHKDFTRLITTFFNGASVISQAGALAALSPQGVAEMTQTLSFYLENARLIKNALASKGVCIFGGENAPYLWVDFGKQNSWDLFQHLLETTGLIATPGSGFGVQGEGFLRFSAFGSRSNILKAIERIEKRWPKNL